MEEEANNKKGKKDNKKEDTVNERTLVKNDEGFEPSDELAEFPTDQQLEEEVMNMYLDVSQDFENSTESLEKYNTEDNFNNYGGNHYFDHQEDMDLFESQIPHHEKQQLDSPIRLEVLYMVLVLLKYPLPSETEIKALEDKASLDNMDFVEFLNTTTWLDKYDEKQIINLTPDSIYSTIYAKKMLFWIFRTDKNQMNFRKFITALKVFQYDNKRAKSFFQWVNEANLTG